MIELAVWCLVVIEGLSAFRNYRRERFLAGVESEHLAIHRREDARSAQRMRGDAINWSMAELVKTTQEVKERLVTGGRFEDAAAIRDRLNGAQTSVAALFRALDDILKEPPGPEAKP
jgi:hypothetical protein